MKKSFVLFLVLVLLLSLAACSKKPAEPAPSAPDAVPAEPEPPVEKDEEAGVISPVNRYLVECHLAEELVFPGGADGAVVQNGQLHFNPHGASKDDWFMQMEAVIQMVADDGAMTGTVTDGAAATIDGTAYTFTCAAPADDDWYLEIAK